MRPRRQDDRARRNPLVLAGPLTVLLALISDLLAGGLPEHLGVVVAVAVAVAITRALACGREGGLAAVGGVLLAQPVLHTLLKSAEGSALVDHSEGTTGSAALLLPAVHVVVAVSVSLVVSFGADALRTFLAARHRWQRRLTVPVTSPAPATCAINSRSPDRRLRVEHLVSSLSHRGPPVLAAQH